MGESNYDTLGQFSTYVGTILYMSPEMNEQRIYSHNTDCWSAGCVLFELITLQIFKKFVQEKKIDTNIAIDNIPNLKSGFKTLLLM